MATYQIEKVITETMSVSDGFYKTEHGVVCIKGEECLVASLTYNYPTIYKTDIAVYLKYNKLVCEITAEAFTAELNKVEETIWSFIHSVKP